jgi:2-keto-4-pentenoate hydratase/2-oxohepta-3-ene-1,7-dioic acid hydratase in catechol pathway
MIWCRFESADGPSYGLVESNVVKQVKGVPWGDHEITSVQYLLDSVKLLLPVVPVTAFASGLNYAKHAIDGLTKFGVKDPKLPSRAIIAYWANSALIAHGEAIIRPADSEGDFQYEGELVAVIGKRAKNVSREDALDYVFGWTIGNDVSERAWQKKDPTLLRSKNCDTFKPMGPWIVTGLNPKDMRTTVRVNGVVLDEFDTGNMLFDVATHIHDITKYCTLQPGDVIWFGTDGVPQNMSPGDVVEVEISGIGTLRNPVEAGNRNLAEQPEASKK